MRHGLGSDLKTNYTVEPPGGVRQIGNDPIVAGGEVQHVRTGSDACWDRVVLEGVASWYHVRYVDEVTQAGSGTVVPVPGAAKLEVSLLSPSSPGFAAPGVVGGHPTLRSVVHTGDFEGLGMGIGVRARLPFRVFTLTGPNRIVIDIAHNGP